MIRPALRGEAFLADVAAARAGEPDALHLWWLGQSGFLVAAAGGLLLLDPYLSDSLTAKYAGTGRPHVRMTERVIDPARLKGIDVVTSSHNHTDHLDAETLGPVLAASPGARLVVPEANRRFAAERLGVDPAWALGLDDGESVTLGPFSLTGVPSAHEEVERDGDGRCRFLGHVVRCGPWTLYHPGDTLRYEGLADRLRPAGVDVALLPINGRDPARGVAGNLDGPEAARLARDIGAGLAVPCHYEMFAFNTVSPDAFVAEAARLGQPVAVVRAGERLSLPAPGDEPWR